MDQAAMGKHSVGPDHWRAMALTLMLSGFVVQGLPTVAIAQVVDAAGAASPSSGDRSWQRVLEGFRRPRHGGSQTELILLGGYQPGKIPVVFIHGLLADASS
ncbi:MAG: hypothetical protein AAGA03_12920 [Planctomycetota bacterium]